jgi:hypothetical protein
LKTFVSKRLPNDDNELARITRRGGWVELVEIDPRCQQVGPTTTRMFDLIVQAGRHHGLDMDVSQRLGDLLSQAGLKRIGTSRHIVPLGHWAGQIGTLAAADISGVVQLMKPLILAQNWTTPEEYERLAVQMFNCKR